MEDRKTPDKTGQNKTEQDRTRQTRQDRHEDIDKNMGKDENNIEKAKDKTY